MRLFERTVIGIVFFFLTAMPLRAQTAEPKADSGPARSQEQAGSPAAVPAVASLGGASAASGIMEIRKLENEQKYSFELRDTELGDLFRVLAHDYKLNLIVDKDVTGRITASFSSISLEDALDEIAESQGLLMEKKNDVIRIKLNLVTKVFVLKYLEAAHLLEKGASAEGAAAASSGAGAVVSEQQPQQASTIFDLLSTKGKVLLGSLPNSVLVIDYPKNIDRVDNFLKAIDKPMTKQVFRLKYIKASDLMGESKSGSAAAPGASAATTNSTASAGATAP